MTSTALISSPEEAQSLADSAVRSREQMLTLVSHDLRNPLGVVQLNAEAAIDRLENCETLEDAREALLQVKSILRASLRMKGLISDVLDKVRLESGTFSIHLTKRNLGEFLSEIIEIFLPLAEEKAISLQLLPMPFVIEATLDFERVYQILSNLLSNAIQFTPAGGEVVLSSSFLEGEIELCVRDSGPGIDPDDIEKIFNKYWTSQGALKSVGLGLSIARELSKAHGGRIWVESEISKGSAFGVLLPCHWERQRKILPVHPTHQPQDRCICLVDDDDDLRCILEENLRALGYQVKTFSDGVSAIKGLSKKSFVPDLMILDYRLPDMNGGDILDRVRSRLQENGIPVIFVSAESNLSHLANHHQASAFLSKPLRMRDLSKMIEHLL